MTLSLNCDLYTFIEQIPLLESRRQKFGIGLCETKISYQVVDIFLVGEVWLSLFGFTSVFWINDSSSSSDSLVSSDGGCPLFGGVSTGSSELCGTGAIDDGRSGYIIGGAFLPPRRFEGATMQK